jgi:hypothetical protein
MNTRHGIVAILALAVLAAGCSTVEKIALSPESRKKLKTVAVVGVDEPERYVLDPGQAPGGAALYMFGAIGGLILGGIEASRAERATSEFTEAIKPTNPDVARHWNESVTGLLRAKGYDVTQVSKLPRTSDGRELDCSSIADKFDAVLITSISAGYAVESEVEPRVLATVRLASSNCTVTHFSDGFLYSARSFKNFTFIERDPKFAFPSRDALVADPQTAKLALRAGLAEIAKRAASEL